MQEILQSGQHPGCPLGPQFMIIFFCQLLTLLYMQKHLICGCRTQEHGIKIYSPQLSLNRPSNLSLTPLLSTPLTLIFLDGNHPLTVSAPLNHPTNSFNFNRSILSQPQDPELFHPTPTPFYKKSGKPKPCHLCSKPLHGAFSDKPFPLQKE
jgi:hypothetical protein